MITRRDFLKLSGASLAAMYAATRQRFMLRAYGATQVGAIPLPGSAIPQFVDELPLLSSHVQNGAIRLVDGTQPLTISMEEFKANVMPSTFLPGTYTGTWVWGYQTAGAETNPEGATAPTYINPVVLALRGTPTKITWVNNLATGADSNLYWEDWTDQTLHWANPNNLPMNDPDRMLNYNESVPAVAHLHGGEVPPQIDGGPDAWFTSDGSKHGHAYYTKPGDVALGNEAIYNYPNTQEAAPIWFHDHALGITRINVYAGIAGAYLLLDAANPWPITAGNIIPMVIQDRMFDTNGQLYFPNVGINPEHPFWVPEFEGDVICVNGKVWPKLTVSNKRYAFWFLNGSNARTYDMFMIDQVSKNFGPPIWIIGTDGGLLNTPVKLDPAAIKPNPNSLTMMPGERYLAVIDFAGYEAGVIGPNGAAYSGSWLLKNNAKTPFPAGVAPDGNTTGRVMQFVVDPASTLPDEPFDVAAATTLRGGTGQPPVIETLTATKTRQMTLNEVMGMFGPFEALVNNTKWGGHSVHKNGTHNGVTFDADGVRSDFFQGPDGDTYYSELPKEGETELWEIVNLTADAHPIHTHLVQFQLMNRQAFNVNKYSGDYNALFPASAAIDPMTGQPYPGGVFIGGYGPPLPVDGSDPRSGGKFGGNLDIDTAKKTKSIYLQGPARPPLPQETGWKDTVIMYPGEVTRILVRWAPQDATATGKNYFPFNPNGGHGFVWHCHIIDHEDNEMMRPDEVVPLGEVLGNVDNSVDAGGNSITPPTRDFNDY